MRGAYLASELLCLVQSAAAHTLCLCFRRSCVERGEIGGRDAFAQIALHLLERPHLQGKNKTKQKWLAR